MKKLLGMCAFMLAFNSNAGVIDSTLYDVESTSGARIATTLDVWHFTAHSDTQATFDILSYERDKDRNLVDYNGDGEHAFFDSMIWLFRDDGDLDASDLIAVNDDMEDMQGEADGSTWWTDSFLSHFLTAGNYLLMVGTCCDSEASYSIDFTNLIQDYGTLEGVDEAGRNVNNSSSLHYLDHGDYRLTYGGDISLKLQAQVSEPPVSLLLLAAVLGLSLRRVEQFTRLH